MAPLTPLISTDWPGFRRPCQLKSLGRATGASAPIATRIRTIVRITRIAVSSIFGLLDRQMSARRRSYRATAGRPVIAVGLDDTRNPNIGAPIVPGEILG